MKVIDNEKIVFVYPSESMVMARRLKHAEEILAFYAGDFFPEEYGIEAREYFHKYKPESGEGNQKQP